MDAISDFVDVITSYEIKIPLTLQIIIIIILIIALCVGGYFMNDVFDIEAMRSGFSWFIFVAVLNLVSLLVIFLYYNSKNGTYKGATGKVGKKGKIGKKGSSVSCNLCTNNLYLQKVRSSNKICDLYTFVPEFQSIFEATQIFDIIIQNGSRVNYDSFVNNLILEQKLPKSITSTPLSLISVNNFKILLNTNSITVLLIRAINENTKALESLYGSFRRPGGKIGYLPLGDSVYGGSEFGLELNSFMADGNILYPNNYTQLTSFRSYNIETNESEIYTIWRPNGQTVTESTGFRGNPEQVQYKSLGDICRTETTVPNVNETLTISEKCLTKVHVKDLELVFIFTGNIKISSENIGLESDSYLIENPSVNNIEIFSIWRTPLNTFLTNCNSTNVIVNNTFIYNMYNVTGNTDTDTNLDESAKEQAKVFKILNSYGNISSQAKRKASNMLASIQIPNLLTSLILCKYYETELLKDLIYYINLYKSSVPEFTTINTLTSTLGELMNLINNVNTQYKKFNQDISRAYTLKDKYTTKYTQKEKYLPKMILNVYDNANNKLLGMSVQIANTNTLLDIINIIFENGIETKIAINSDGIAQGGIFMNSIQEVVLRVCKMLEPPSRSAYTIKDECLGTFALDRERAEVIDEFIDVYNDTVKLIEKITKKSDLYIQTGEVEAIIENDKDRSAREIQEGIDSSENLLNVLRNYLLILDYKVGQICGHIDNYLVKLDNGNLDEFTTSRIKSLKLLYTDANIYLKKILGQS